MGNYDSIDLDWTWDGDYLRGSDGDIGDTSDNYLRSLENEIRTICQSSLSDWELDPFLGATLDDFVGEANTRENGQKIQDRVSHQIIDAGIVRPGDLYVKVFPVGIYKIMIMIQVRTQITPYNHLTTSDPITVNLVFDTREQSVMVIEKTLPRVDL